LSVLPQPADDDDGFDTDDSDPPLSAPSSERIHPNTNVDKIKEAEPKGDPPIGKTEEEGYQSQPPLLPIPSVTSPDRYPTANRQYGQNSPPDAEAAEAEPGQTTDVSATGEKDAPNTERIESTSKSASASASASQAAVGSASNRINFGLDSIIDLLLEVRGSRPGKQVLLLEKEIRYLCTKAREIFMSQPILLELEAPIKVGQAQTFRLFCAISADIVRSLVTFTDSTSISSEVLSFADFHPRQIIYSWATTWIMANSL